MKRIVKKNGKSLEYTLICSTRTNCLLQALPEGKVRLYAPKGASLREMDQLVLSRWEWIEEMHKSLSAQAADPAFDPKNGVLIQGKRVPLEIQRSVRNEIFLADGRLIVRTNTQNIERIRESIKAWLCALALEKIREAVDRHAPGVGKPFGRITVREQKTRWGSCSGKRNLNFNWKLILAPPEALEYVVIHELCHLLHFNHSEKFWQAVSARMPEYDVWKKWLRAHAQELTI